MTRMTKAVVCVFACSLALTGWLNLMGNTTPRSRCFRYPVQPREYLFACHPKVDNPACPVRLFD